MIRRCRLDDLGQRACGFHAGEADIMRRTVELARRRGGSGRRASRISRPPRLGRRPVPGLKSSEIENLVASRSAPAGVETRPAKGHAGQAHWRALQTSPARTNMTPRRSRARIKSVAPISSSWCSPTQKMVRAGGAEAPKPRLAHESVADRPYEDDGNLVREEARRRCCTSQKSNSPMGE